MKSAIAFCVFFSAGLALARPDEHYTNRYDTVNLDEMLSNKKVLVPNINSHLIVKIITMKSAVVVCVVFFTALAFARPGDDHYTDRYDTVDLDEIMSNKKLLVPYIKCILDQGKCAPDAKELKEHIREALENECGKCTDAQKKGTRRVIAHLINNEEDYWNQLTVKYDPDKKFTVKYEKELREVKA
ncbi:unnamed protein product [Arctia plantaginis]|uniref:Chemosensory protein n=1 Tax=Arctia plantaginis TaxID=874455 RepID=A0A8S0ZNS3_ARCPL|nr:unnamed protein product [Arctia plantaginis]